MTMQLPGVFLLIVQDLLFKLRKGDEDPSVITVTFGEGVIKELPRDLLLSLFAIDKLYGVPVQFPESPAIQPGLIEVKTHGKHLWASTWISAVCMADSFTLPVPTI